MIVAFHPEADAEFAAAVAWYESKRTTLGDDLEDDVYLAIDLICEQPDAWQGWPGLDGVRVFPLDRFPFLIPYAREDDRLVILAIAHSSRRPGYWRARVASGER